jgi:protein TonB
MFEQMLLPEGGTHQGRNAAVAFVVQLGVLAMAATLMAYFDVLPLPFPQPVVPLVLSAPPPPPPPAAAARRAPEQTTAKNKLIVPRTFIAPTVPVTVPQQVTIAADAPPVLAGAPDGGVAGGVPGGIPGGVVGGSFNGAPGMFSGPPVAAAKPPAPVVPAVASQIRVGGDVQAARLKNEVVPSYPPIAKAARVEGIVRLSAAIAPNGIVENLRVLSGNPLLTEAAEKAVKQWTYQPTVLNGKPVEVLTEIDVKFTLG